MAERDPNVPVEIPPTASQKIIHVHKGLSVSELTKKLDALSTTVEVRLSNGMHVFDELKRDSARHSSKIEELQKSITPQKPDWWKIVFGVIAIMFTFLGAWWGLSQKLSERPTVDQVKEIVQTKTEVINTQIANLQRQLEEIKREIMAQRKP